MIHATHKAYPRGDWDRISDAQKGTWRPLTRDGKKTARFCCRFCGFVAALDTHRVSDDGIVLPSVQCPVSTCTFHEFIKLGGWRG